MNPNSLIPQIIGRSDALLHFGLALAAAGLAVLALASRPGAHPALARLLFFGYALFALLHLLAMHWILKQWSAAFSALKHTEVWRLGNVEQKEDLFSVLSPPDGTLLMLHLAFDLFVLAGLWWLSRRRGLA